MRASQGRGAFIGAQWRPLTVRGRSPLRCSGQRLDVRRFQLIASGSVGQRTAQVPVLEAARGSITDGLGSQKANDIAQRSRGER